MYFYSNDYIKFKRILNENNLFFSSDILNKLCNSKLKIQINLLYENLKEKGFYPLKVSDEEIYYVCFGRKEILKSDLKKFHIYDDNNLSWYGNKKVKYFLNVNVSKYINISLGGSNVKENTENIIIYSISSLNEIRSIDVNSLDDINLYIFSNDPLKILSLISDVILLVEAKYDSKIAGIVDEMISYGKEVLVAPGDVWNKNCYFSNYLIKEGASVILSKTDLNMYLKK